MKTLRLTALACLLPGCAALAPTPLDTRQRLAQFPTQGLPLERPATIRWNGLQVPWIEAGSDRDLAFLLGMVHGHLRGGQLELLKRVSQGRLAEVAGALAAGVDHALRILDFGHAAPEIERSLPAQTRAWLEAFVVGINFYRLHGPRPPEWGLLGFKPEPWTVRDAITLGRLAGTDINWLVYFSLLRERGRPGFAELWRRTLEAGSGLAPAGQDDPQRAALSALLAGLSRSGSNSLAVSAARSASGGALLANDPHLGLRLPNLWLIAGVRSPSYHAVGLMLPGLPFFGLGRTPHLAWGGTNLRGAASDLYDVSELEPSRIEARRFRIARRFWFGQTCSGRWSPLGPILTDAGVVPNRGGETLALRWVGHLPSDEYTPFLQALRARNGAELRAAFAGFGVPGQNILYAERGGGIGHFIAATLPRRARPPAADPVLDAADPENGWQGLLHTPELPWIADPPLGVLASANDRPPEGAERLGFFYSDDDRVRRLHQLLAAHPRHSRDTLAAIQADTRSPDAAALAAALLRQIEDLPGPAPEPAFVERLRGFEGDYAADSPGAVAFELLLYHLAPGVYGADSVDGLADAVNQWNFLTAFFAEDVAALPDERRQTLLRKALEAAARDAERFPTWGHMHRLPIAHGLRSLPLVGRRFVYDDLPAGGSRETPMKTAHGLVGGRHEAAYGSQSRHISDLSDPDANWFVLLGGQDGWLGSANFLDQVPLWRAGQYLRMPLRAETVAREFPVVMELLPAARRH